MKCPACGSNSIQVLKSKKEDSKSKEITKLLLKCEECDNIFREVVSAEKPVNYRVIISEHEQSRKDFVKIYPDEKLSVGDILEVGDGTVEITSLENIRGGRTSKALASEISTIWGFSRDMPSRIGFSIDYNGRIVSKKVEVDREFSFTIGDVIKIEDHVFNIKSLKTLERKMRKGSARAAVIKRVYGKPIGSKINYRHDLTDKVVQIVDEESEDE
jgi:uncharacterized Zn finger protein